MTVLVLMLAAGAANAATLLSDDFASTANWTITTGGVATIGTTTTLGGTVLPDVTTALDLRWTGSGAAYAVYDFGSNQDVIYVEFLINTMRATQSIGGYEELVHVGPNANMTSPAVGIRFRKESEFLCRYFGNPNFDEISQSAYLSWGVWTRIGLALNRTAGSVVYYVNGRVAKTGTMNSGVLRYLVIGGTVTAGHRFQVTRVRVTTDGFLPYTAPENNVGRGDAWHVDPGLNSDAYTSYSSWRGMHSEPYTANGTDYIDGPLKRMPDNWTNVGAYDKVFFKGGTIHSHAALNNYPRFAGTITTDVAKIEVTSYGTGVATLAGGMRLTGGWTATGANNIYTTTVTNLANLGGVWVNGYGLRLAASADLSALPGHYYPDAGNNLLYVRLYENGVVPHNVNPGLYDVYLRATSGCGFLSAYTWAHDLAVVSGNISVSGTGALVEDVTGLNGTFSISNGGTLRRARFISNGGGYAYNGGGNGYTGSEPVGVGFGGATAVAYYYHNYYEGFGLGTVSGPAVIAYNEFVNTSVNSLQVVETNSTEAQPVIIANNTVWAAPVHADDAPFPINEDMPGHGIVLHNGFDGYAIVVNNLVLNKHARVVGGSYGSDNYKIYPTTPPIGGIWDYNASYKTGATTSYYGDVNFDANVTSLTAHLATNNFTGVGGGGAVHDMKLDSAPVANAALGTGKWDAANIDGTLTTELLGTPVAGLPAELTTTIDGDAIGATPYVGAYGYDAPTPEPTPTPTPAPGGGSSAATLQLLGVL